MIPKLFFFIIAINLFVGCKANEVEPQTHIPAPIYNNAPTPIDEDMFMTSPSTSTSTPALVIPAIVTTKTDVSTSIARQLYSILPTSFNFRNTLGINFMTDLRFIDETLLTFEGWVPSETIISTITTEDTKPSDTFGLGSFSLDLKAGGLDLMSGNFLTETLNFSPLLNNPCQEQCVTEIWGQSPDAQWQIIKISTGRPEEIGIWLVGINDKIQLVSYIPPDSNWQWATDSSLLWYTFYDRDYGIYADAISLKSPLSTHFLNRDENDPMNPLTHLIAFSPVEKTIISTKQNGDSNELYIIDLTKNSPVVTSTQVIPGLVALSWNEATQSYFLEIVREDGLEFREIQGISIIIPIELIYTMYPSVENGQIGLEAIAPKRSFAISPSGKYIAIAYAHGEIKIFPTQENPAP